MKLINISEDLKSNAYPGRGIVIGKSQDGQCAVTAYFIMGRSVNSRNRVFVAEGENLRTQAHDPALLTDPSLVIYFPVRMFPGGMIVTNGDQTDTIYNLLSTEAQSTPGCCFVRALRTRTFEPDP
ncbi:MAG: inosine monophosphate cyclohydrolase, partial [Acutalibacter sp.]|nr:inosine monophosphate cyclohydrolase [Acutalibacter sp.]